MKLILKNVGTGFQTLGRGEMSTGPMLGLTRKSEIQISPEQFTDYEHDIRYFHTPKSGEVKLALTLDGEVTTPDEVRALIAAAPTEVEIPVPDSLRSAEDVSKAATLVSGGLVVNSHGPVDPAAVLGDE